MSKRELKPDLAYQKAFGKHLKKLREEVGWTQVDLSVYSKVSDYQISILENGHEGPNLQTLKALALALGKHPSDLLNFKFQLVYNTSFPKEIKKPSGSTTFINTLVSNEFFSKGRSVKDVLVELKNQHKLSLKSSEVSSALIALVAKKILRKTRKGNKNEYVKK